MKELSKQITNAEARFSVLEEQMVQNQKDHEVILNEVRHNCKENSSRFDKIEEMLQKALDGQANNQWVVWYIRASILAILTASAGVIVFVIQKNII